MGLVGGQTKIQIKSVSFHGNSSHNTVYPWIQSVMTQRSPSKASISTSIIGTIQQHSSYCARSYEECSHTSRMKNVQKEEKRRKKS